MARPNRTGVRGLYRRGDRYVIDLRWNEPGTNRYRRHRETLPEGTTAGAAKKRAQKLLTSALAGEYRDKVEAAEENAPPRRLHASLDAYRQHMDGERPKTKRSRASLIRVLKRTVPFDADPALHEVTSFDLERYKAARAKDGASPATVNRGLAMLHAAYGLFAQWGWVDKGHVAQLREVKKRQEPAGRVRELTAAEERRLWKAVGDSPIRPIVACALLSGLRRANVVQLLKSQVSLERRELVIDKGTKNNRVLRVPIGDALAGVLREAMESHDGDHVFVNSRGRPYTPEGFKTMWQRARDAAKLRDFRFHDLRHSFATRVRRSGAGLDVLKELLGHSTIVMSNRYAHVGRDEMREAVAGLTLVTENPAG